ncbi:MAG: bifunctional hydroxymethylpyrimidine kinase/phosphomethylpyrimidine kinase [Blautia sp.]|nr:bifunctional hydroxymethylpyrimidine kinase/phosphomethylpyrimidine kinase [Blautia sp.]
MHTNAYEKNSFVVVVGGVNIDIGGRSFRPLTAKTSNPGEIHPSLGGVGRNIAHNIRLLGDDVCFLSAFGDDIYAGQIEAGCARLGIDISRARIVPGGSTSTYIFINDADGDMTLALSDMRICEAITPDYLMEHLDIINRADVLVLDTNIPEESVKYLAVHAGVPVFADPVSTVKAAKLLPVLDKIHTLKPNLSEAEMLSGVKIVDEESLMEAAEVLLSKGIKRVFISMGADGIFAAEAGHMKKYPVIPANIKNTTGAGDAFMAGLVHAYLQNMPQDRTASFALACASVAAESEETINPELSVSKAVEKEKQQLRKKIGS